MLIAQSLISIIWNASVGGILNLIWTILCIPVYAIIRNHFNIFVRIAELDISSSVNINEIYQRVTMIITIVMTFYVAISIIQYTVNPEKLSDKEKGAGKVAYRIIATILLIAFVPDIFSIAYKLQNKLIETQVFSKIILGREVEDYRSFGSEFAASTFSAFYRVDKSECGDNCDEAEANVKNVIDGISKGATTLSIIKSSVGEWIDGVDFDGLLALIFGCYVIYVIFLYSIDVAVRCVQMLFLQIIAPIAIMSYLVPNKNNLFQKWVKQCTTTYLDLFIRISIMYFAMLLLKVIQHAYDPLSVMVNNGVGPITYIFFVLGVLVFIQRVPKLLKELFPESGAASIGFGTQWKTRKEPLMKSINSIKKPISATVGGVSSAISTISSLKKGRLKDALNNKTNMSKGRKFMEGIYSVGKSAYAGGKDAAGSNSIFGAYANRNKQSRAVAEQLEKGGSNVGHDFRGIHYESERERRQHYIEGLEKVVNAKKTVSDASANLKTNKAAQALIADWNERGIGDASKRATFGKEIEKLMRMHATDDTQMNARLFASKVSDALSNVGVTGTDFTKALSGIMEQFEKDTGKNISGQNQGPASLELKILTEQIKEARKIAAATRNDEGNKAFEFKDKNGNSISTAETNIYGFAENLGDVETAAQQAIFNEQHSEKYKAAVANANVPGQKKDSGSSS